EGLPDRGLVVDDEYLGPLGHTRMISARLSGPPKSRVRRTIAHTGWRCAPRPPVDVGDHAAEPEAGDDEEHGPRVVGQGPDHRSREAADQEGSPAPAVSDWSEHPSPAADRVGPGDQADGGVDRHDPLAQLPE